MKMYHVTTIEGMAGLLKTQKPINHLYAWKYLWQAQEWLAISPERDCIVEVEAYRPRFVFPFYFIKTPAQVKSIKAVL